MAKPSRRQFVQATAAAGAASHAPPSFSPKAELRRLSDNLFLFEDTCHVYVLRQGRHGLLIDFGSGAVLRHLPALGVDRIDWILHTHHHRDQCQGDRKAVARRIPIAVPAHERHLFEDAENFWRNRRVFHLYYVRNDFQTVTRNIPVAQSLHDYSTFRWRDLDLLVLPTPGHTLGSVSLLATIDSRRVAFTGDLLHSPGKLLNLYDTQVNYGGSEGIDLGIYSLARLRERKPELLLPSHGEPMPDPDDALRLTQQRLTDYYRFQAGKEPAEGARPYAVSPHLIAHSQTMSSFYAIVSDSGKAMFIDYGSAGDTPFWAMQVAAAITDRMRFLEHSIPELKRSYGMRSIDVAMPSHMHDDHMNGFPHLVRHHKTRIWCLENMVDIFQNPRGKNLGCILPEPTPIDRAFRPGERFRWEEFDFEITHSPGHTEYQMALFVTLDGKRVAFTGDAFFLDGAREGTLRHNVIFRNQVQNDSHLRSIRNLIGHEPTLLCPGHGRPYPVNRPLLLATEQRLRTQQQFFFDLLPEGDVDFGLDPSWVSIYPYQPVIRPGTSRKLEIRVRNYRAAPMRIQAALVAPPEWRVTPDTVTLDVPARAEGHAHVTVSIPRDWSAPSPRLAIALDVMRDGKYLGQITEAVVEV